MEDTPNDSTFNSSQSNTRTYGSMMFQGSMGWQRVAVISCLICLAAFNVNSIRQTCRLRNLRQIDYLLINLCVSLILLCCIASMLQLNSIDQLPIPQQFHCSFTNFCKNFCTTSVSLSSFALSWASLSSMKKFRASQKLILRTGTLVALVWIVALLLSLPTTLTLVSYGPVVVEISMNASLISCYRIPLLKYTYLDIFYEMIRYLVINLSYTVCVFMETYTVRPKLKHLCMTHLGQMNCKIWKVRLAYFRSTLFIVLWNAYGICNVKYAVDTLYSSTSVGEMNTTLEIILGIGSIYSIMNPLLVLLIYRRPGEEANDNVRSGVSSHEISRLATIPEEDPNELSPVLSNESDSEPQNELSPEFSDGSESDYMEMVVFKTCEGRFDARLKYEIIRAAVLHQFNSV